VAVANDAMSANARGAIPPFPMFVDQHGTVLSEDDVIPNGYGIYRAATCGALLPAWNARVCLGSYSHLAIESLDKDWASRKLGPVALSSGGYTDLLRGVDFPAKSTFFGTVAGGRAYELYFTSTNPSDLRLQLINAAGAESTDAVTVRIWYSDPQRLQVFVRGEYVEDLNYFDGKHKRDLVRFGKLDSWSEQWPTVAMDAGSNAFNHATQEITVTLKGDDAVDIKTMPVVMVSLSLAVSVDKFYEVEASFVANLCFVLQIPPQRMRIVNVVPDTGRRRLDSSDDTSRRVLSGAGAKVDFEIEPNPVVQFRSRFAPLPENGTMVVEVERSVNVLGACSVHWSATLGANASDADFAILDVSGAAINTSAANVSGVLHFAAQQTVRRFNVSAVLDGLVEPHGSEYVTLYLQQPINASLGNVSSLHIDLQSVDLPPPPPPRLQTVVSHEQLTVLVVPPANWTNTSAVVAAITHYEVQVRGASEGVSAWRNASWPHQIEALQHGADDGDYLTVSGLQAYAQYVLRARVYNAFGNSAWSTASDVMRTGSLCGNGVREALQLEEQCDDGNTAAGDGCSPGCTVEPGWACALGTGPGGIDLCETGCGDGIVPDKEECDDGNLVRGDGCSAACTVERGWTCPRPSLHGASSVCTTQCGDGIIAGTEECDDGNTVAGDGCAANCTLEDAQRQRWSCTTRLERERTVCIKCGNGVREAVAHIVPFLATTTILQASLAGDLHRTPPPAEGCDDGNQAGDDGCDAMCNVEPGWSCGAQGTTCRAGPSALPSPTVREGRTAAVGVAGALRVQWSMNALDLHGASFVRLELEAQRFGMVPEGSGNTSVIVAAANRDADASVPNATSVLQLHGATVNNVTDHVVVDGANQTSVTRFSVPAVFVPGALLRFRVRAVTRVIRPSTGQGRDEAGDWSPASAVALLPHPQLNVTEVSAPTTSDSAAAPGASLPSATSASDTNLQAFTELSVKLDRLVEAAPTLDLGEGIAISAMAITPPAKPVEAKEPDVPVNSTTVNATDEAPADWRTQNITSVASKSSPLGAVFGSMPVSGGERHDAAITLDSGVVGFAASTTVVPEHESRLELPLVRTGGLFGAITIAYQVHIGTSAAGLITTSATSGERTFVAGQRNTTLLFNVASSDAVWRNANVSFDVCVSAGAPQPGAQPASVSSIRCTTVIVAEDDVPPQVALSIPTDAYTADRITHSGAGAPRIVLSHDAAAVEVDVVRLSNSNGQVRVGWIAADSANFKVSGTVAFATSQVSYRLVVPLGARPALLSNGSCVPPLAINVSLDAVSIEGGFVNTTHAIVHVLWRHCVPTRTVTVQTVLRGFTLQTFGAAAQLAYRRTVAATAGVDVTDVAIENIAGASRRGRRLTTEVLQFDVIVQVATLEVAEVVSSQLAVGISATVFGSELVQAGIAVPPGLSISLGAPPVSSQWPPAVLTTTLAPTPRANVSSTSREPESVLPTDENLWVALVIGLSAGASLVGTALYYRRKPQAAPQGRDKARAKGSAVVVPTTGEEQVSSDMPVEAYVNGHSTGRRVSRNPIDTAKNDHEVAIAVQCHGSCMECGCFALLREDPGEPGAMYCKECWEVYDQLHN